MRLYAIKEKKSRPGIITIKGNWHGRTMGSQLMSDNITQKKWIIRAANHLNEIDEYLTANMELTRLQIDEFCGAARAVIHFKKKSILQPMKRQKTQREWEIGGLS